MHASDPVVPLIAQLHLMNDDLFSAHFLLRKLQEDDWGKWLHAILHQAGKPIGQCLPKY